MALKKFNPVTPGLRFRVATDFAEVTKGTPEKSLLAPIKKSGGRNNAGHMTMRYIGGGHKRRYRIIDFKRSKFDVPAVVKAIEYDPNRTAFIALIYYKDGEKSYILAPQGLNVGQEIVSGKSVAPEVGNTLPLGNMPLGSIIHNVELHPGKGGNMCRSAGSSAQLLAKDGKYVAIKLPSGEQRMILATCLATIGSVSNSDHANTIMGKAGRKRWAGRRPRVRGVAMNPVDHPMGGGEGRASGGHPRSRKGIPAKGYKTRQKNKSSERLIINRKGKK
jgi:large subunit ribosomal protein L2